MRRALQVSFRKSVIPAAASAAMSMRFAKLYTVSHEWVDFDAASKTASVGITNHAQDALGDVVFVGLPNVGDALAKGAVAGELESVKASSDYYTPIAGEVASINEALRDEPQLINQSAEDKAWIFKLKNAAEPAGLMSADEYKEFLSKGTH